MSNDYEYLGDSQMPPPMAPRAPSNAHPDLITGLHHTQALKADDDVDLESNRPRGNNNLSFSDNLNPRRSEPSVAGTKTSRSAESDEESKKDTHKDSDSEQEKKNHKCGTCWYIFAGVTIFLAVISLLGLGAFLLLNSNSEEPISAALYLTNETSTPEFKPTTANIPLRTTRIPLDANSTIGRKPTEKSVTGSPAKTRTASVNITSTIASTSSLPTTMSEAVTSQPVFEMSTVTNETSYTELISTVEKETTTIEAAKQTENKPLSIEETVPPTANVPSSTEETTPITLETSTEAMMSNINDDEKSTTEGRVSTEEITNSETTTNGTIAEN